MSLFKRAFDMVPFAVLSAELSFFWGVGEELTLERPDSSSRAVRKARSEKESVCTVPVLIRTLVSERTLAWGFVLSSRPVHNSSAWSWCREKQQHHPNRADS